MTMSNNVPAHSDNASPRGVEYSGEERRCFPRVRVQLSAILQAEFEQGRTFMARPAIVHDVSMSGARVSLPITGLVFMKQARELEIIIQVSPQGKPMSFQCVLRYCEENAACLHAGLDFTQGDFSDYKWLAWLCGH